MENYTKPKEYPHYEAHRSYITGVDPVSCANKLVNQNLKYLIYVCRMSADMFCKCPLQTDAIL